MTGLVAAPMLVALVSIVLTLAARSRSRLQRAASLLGGLAYAGAVAALTWLVVLGPGAPGAAAYQLGGWQAPFGITLVADALSAFMLVIAAIVGLAALSFSVVFVDVENQQVFYHPLFHCLLLGVSGAFLTGDLFNLFVWFEVMLVTSYVFVAFYGGDYHTAAAVRYLVLNVLGGAFMLLGIGGLYAVTGTLNMADMARRLADPAAFGIDVGPVVGLSALLFVTFALKAGLVPFQFWVPGAYRAAPLPVAAMLAGVTKKVGAYAIIRLYFTVFGGVRLAGALPFGVDSVLAALAPVLFVMGFASILVGGIGAVARASIKELLAYSSIGQVGFISVPIAVAAASPALRTVGLIAALVYALHHALAKGLLFLTAATVRGATGTNRFAELGGLAARSPLLAGAFLVGGLSLVGIPPLTGFFGKLLVLDAATRQLSIAGGTGPALVLLGLLAGAVLTIVYVTRAWTESFWGARTEAVTGADVDPAQLSVLAVLASLVILAGVGFEGVYAFADLAATAAVDQAAYVDLVDPAGGGRA